MGATNSSSGKQIKYYSLKGKVSETETPHFALAEKIDGKWVNNQQFDTMEGHLKSAAIETKEYNGSKFNVFVLVMDDDNETSRIEMTHNSVTYSLINTLASNVNKIETYKIQLYKKKSNGDGGKVFWNGAAAIRLNGSDETQKWSIDPKLAPKKVPVVVNGKPFMQNGKAVYDSADLNAFWEQIYQEKVVAVLGSAPRTASSTVYSAPAASSSNEPAFTGSTDDDDSGLPF